MSIVMTVIVWGIYACTMFLFSEVSRRGGFVMESKRFWRVNDVANSSQIYNSVINRIVCNLNEEPVAAEVLVSWGKAVGPFSCRRSVAVLQPKEVRYACL